MRFGVDVLGTMVSKINLNEVDFFNFLTHFPLFFGGKLVEKRLGQKDLRIFNSSQKKIGKTKVFLVSEKIVKCCYKSFSAFFKKLDASV